MGGVETNPLCFLGGVGGGGPLDIGCAGVIGAGAFVDGEGIAEARGDPYDGGNLEVETAGGDTVGAEVTRGGTGPKEDTVGTAGRVF